MRLIASRGRSRPRSVCPSSTFPQLYESEGGSAGCPGPRPVDADAGRGEVTEVDAGKWVGDVPYLVVFGAGLADGDEGEPVVGRSVLAGDDLVGGDVEVFSTFKTGLDLDADRGTTVGREGQDVIAGVGERLLLRLAAEC